MVILSYGMGVDSTAILLRWLEDPTSRDFDLADLIVITAMTGDEFENTGRLVRQHILPRLAAAGIRFVQVARAGLSETDDIVVLSDTRAPADLHLGGAYKLSDELKAAGTVPQVASGKRLCSLKYKGWVLDRWIEQELAGRPFRHVMGFNADEDRRVVRDCSYSTEQRHSEYPLVAWSWGRAACEDYIAGVVGEAWAKSCCTFCPFAGGKVEHLVRLRTAPAAAADALQLEHMSLALNPRMTLYKGKSLAACLEADGNTAALTELRKRLAKAEWALYRVRRVYRAAGCADRSVTVELIGSRAEMELELANRAIDARTQVVTGGGSRRTYLRARGAAYPAVEDMLVVAPAGIANKERKSFAKLWAKAA